MSGRVALGVTKRFSTAAAARLGCLLLLVAQRDVVYPVAAAQETGTSWDIRIGRSGIPDWTASEDLTVRSQTPVGTRSFSPAEPSPYLCLVCRNESSQNSQTLRLVDLRDGQVRAELTYPGQSLAFATLSGDGRYFVAPDPQDGAAFAVWSFATGEQIASFQLDTSRPHDRAYAALAASGLILLGYGNRLEAYELPGGRSMFAKTYARMQAWRYVPSSNGMRAHAFAVSPDGQYLAVPDAEEPGILIIHLKDPDRVTRIPITPPPDAARAGRATYDNADPECFRVAQLGFSPSGDELAAIGFYSTFEPYLYVWQMSTGRESIVRRLQLAPRRLNHDDLGDHLRLSAEQPLRWLGDRQGWQTGFRDILLRDSGMVVPLPHSSGPGPRWGTLHKPLPDGRLLVSVDDSAAGEQAGRHSLRSISLPPERLAAIRSADRSGYAVDAVLPELARPSGTVPEVLPTTGETDGGWRFRPSVRPLARDDAGTAWSIAIPPRRMPRRLFCLDSRALPHALLGCAARRSPSADGPMSLSQDEVVSALRRADGTLVQECSVPSEATVLDVSETGVVLVRWSLQDDASRGGFDFGRLDFFRIDTGDHVLGFRPYRAEDSHEPPAYSTKQSLSSEAVGDAAFVTPKRLLTVNSAGRLILWELPAFRRLWIRDVPGLGRTDGTPLNDELFAEVLSSGFGLKQRAVRATSSGLLLTPDHGAVLVRDAVAYRLVATDDGSQRGAIPHTLPYDAIDGMRNLVRAGQGLSTTHVRFSHDGSRLAGLVTDSEAAHALAIWNLATGRMETGLRLESGAPSFFWCDESRMLIPTRSEPGGSGVAPVYTLTDVVAGKFLRSFRVSSGPGRGAGGAAQGGMIAEVDRRGRLWYAGTPDVHSDPPYHLASVPFPTSDASIDVTGTGPPLARGQTVAVTVTLEGVAPESAARHADSLQLLFEQQLVNNGWLIRSVAPSRLTIHVDSREFAEPAGESASPAETAFWAEWRRYEQPHPPRGVTVTIRLSTADDPERFQLVHRHNSLVALLLGESIRSPSARLRLPDPAPAIDEPLLKAVISRLYGTDMVAVLEGRDSFWGVPQSLLTTDGIRDLDGLLPGAGKDAHLPEPPGG